MKAPSSVNAQCGMKTNKYGEGKSKSSTGSNQGRVSGVKHRYQSHPRKQGQ